MLQKIKFLVEGIKNKGCKYIIESETDTLAGVKDVDVDYKSGECQIEFDESKISKDKILKKIRDLGYKEKKTATSDSNECTYFVDGMHCASCEVLIEKRLLKEGGVKFVDASTNRNSVIVKSSNKGLSVERLNKIFKDDDYIFSERPHKNQKKTRLMSYNEEGQILIDKKKFNNFLIIFGASLLFIFGFIFLNKSGIPALISVNAKSALPMFFVFGILAGFSSCAALVGGIILSMSKQWIGMYSKNSSNFNKFQPHIMFNIGRLISYALLGIILGAIGSVFQLSLTFTSALVIGVSIMMLFLGLQMIGIKSFQKFQIKAPKFMTRYISDESNFNGRYTPMLMGSATVFLPCGFTITAQGLALTSGSMLQGGLIMLFFALGTLPALLSIGFSSVVFSKKTHVANRFLRIAGIVVLFFAVFNINSQLNVLGLRSLDDIGLKSSKAAIASEEGLPPIVDGKQILKTDALAYGYEPNRLKVRKGVPVRWEITDKGTSGCTNAIMSRGLFDGQIDLVPGNVSVKEFTPEEAGRYKFSCWMGMISGTIDVVDIDKDGSSVPVVNDAEIIPSGAKGCGCGGGGGGTGFCGG